MKNPIVIYIEMLDEGTSSLMETTAVPIDSGLYIVQSPKNYDPEFDWLEFLPGDQVRLKNIRLHNGQEGLLAIHPNPAALKVFVESTEKHAPEIRETHAIEVGNGIYELQATPHYTTEQLWKFPPGSKVRLKKKLGAYSTSYWLVVEQVD
jgi:hypothetical protein